jgi:hypothetical protein
MNLLTTPILKPLTGPLNRWAEHSQSIACRNAMIASTAITARRRERDEVQEFVEALLAQRSVAVAPGAREVAQLG